jgi:Cu-processing system permease protein
MKEIKILKYIMNDFKRNKWIIIYTIFLFLISSGLIYSSKDFNKSIASILNVTLIIIPLVSTLFTALHYYNSIEFLQMLLTQPIKRATIFRAEFYGIAFSLSSAYLIGIMLPVFIQGVNITSILLAITGVILTIIFTSISLFIAISIDEKIKGMGILFFSWLFFSVLFDGLIILIYFLFNNYPLEKVTIILTMLNPVDIGRIIILMKLDLSAMLGYNGAVFMKFFGSTFGIVLCFAVCTTWILIPSYLALRKFNRKNF